MPLASHVTLCYKTNPRLGGHGLKGFDDKGRTRRSYLAFGSDADVSGDGRVGSQVDGLLYADIGQGVLSEDGASIQVSRHEATEARKGLQVQEGKKNVRHATR